MSLSRPVSGMEVRKEPPPKQADELAYLLVDGETGARQDSAFASWGACKQIDKEKDAEDPKREDSRLVPRPLSNGAGRGRMGLSMKPIKVWLWSGEAVSSTSGAALARTWNVVPANYQDWSSLTSLYDECRVIRGVHKFAILQAVQSVSASVTAATCYEPTDPTALTSIVDCLTHVQHYGPVQVACSETALVSNPCPRPVTRTGFFIFPWHMPKGSARNTASATTVQGEWAATTDAGDIFGYVKTYIVGAGGTNLCSLQSWHGVEMEFRSRR